MNRYFETKSADGGTPELEALAGLRTVVTESIKESQTAVADAKAALVALTDRISKVEAKGNRIGELSDKDAVSPFDLIAKHEQVEAMRAGKSNYAKFEVDGARQIVQKSIVGDAFGGSPSDGFPVVRDRVEGVFQYTRPLDVLDLIPSGVTSSNTVEFVRNGSNANGAGIQALEGDAKSEQSFSFVLDTAPVRTYAVYATASRQVLADAVSLADFIRNRLGFNVRSLLEAQVVAGSSSSVTGLIEAATAYSASAAKTADKIGQAITSLRADNGAASPIVVLSPGAWFAIQAERATTAEYVNSGGWSNPSNGPLWGAPVVVTASVSDAQALVFDRNAVKLYLRQAITTELGYINDQFTKNMVTILVELRAAFAILEPAQVLKLDI